MFKESKYLIILIILLSFSCGRGKVKETITIAGSTSVQPFMEKLAEEYMNIYSDIQINVQGGGSTTGIQSVKNGICQVGMSSRKLKGDEEGLWSIPIALDGISVIVNPKNKISDLKLEDIQKIYSLEIKNWKEVGGDDSSIIVISREEGSGTRDAFCELVMKEKSISSKALVQDSNGSVREVVATTKYAIGFISTALVNKRIKALKINGVEFSVDKVREGSYALARKFLLVCNEPPKEEIKKFIDFVLSIQGQRILAEEGLITTQK